MNNKVSVIMRTGVSRIGCLEQAVNSVLDQHHKHIEIVLVENGSNGLGDWVATKNWRSCELKYYQQDEANRCTAGNLGLTKATGDFICFLDDDDIFYPNHLSILVGALENNVNAGAAYSVSHEVKSQIHSYTPFLYTDKAPRIFYRREFSRGALFANNYLPIQSVLFRKQLFETHGGFDSELQRLEDWNLWARYASQSEFVFIDTVTSMYRKPAEKKEVGIRNKEHDDYYFLARAKQSEIPTFFDQSLFDEIVTDIFRNTFLSRFSIRLVYGGKLSGHPVFNKICEQWKLSFLNNRCEMSVLDSIRLTNEIVTNHRVIWNIHRVEKFILKKTNKILQRLA
ncbi:MAG: glycosyltransferase [Methylococcales bacterium]